MKILIYHNILWAKYKGAVFSRLHLLCTEAGLDASFVQIAETEVGYLELGAVDLSYHRYPFRLLSKGVYSRIPLPKRIWLLCKDLLIHRSNLVVLPGYNLVEYWMMLLLCMLLRRRRAVFCDSTALDGRKSRAKEGAKRLFFSRCHGIFCYGTRSRDYILSYGISPTKIHFPCYAAALPHGYDPRAVQAVYEEQAAETFTVPEYIFIGRLSAEKGLFDLLEAFGLVRATLGSARLTLVGAGPLEGQLKEFIVSRQLGDAVTLLGARTLDDVVPLLYRNVALILPSSREPWGLVVNEALSYGCPVVVSDHCGSVADLVIEGVTGYSFPTRNIELLAKAMIATVDLSNDRAATARNCLKLMSAFTAEKAASRILAGCTQMIERDV